MTKAHMALQNREAKKKVAIIFLTAVRSKTGSCIGIIKVKI
jgi:hypothetical protein